MASKLVARGEADALPNNADWMSKLPPDVIVRPITMIAIPGSHDSFTSSLNKKGPLGPDVSKVIRDLSKIFGSKARQIVFRWSVTQSLTIPEQLRAGIRYLDFRAASKPGKSDLYFLHGLYGGKIVDSLIEINEFLNQNPREVILLDFNHFYAVSKEAHAALLEKIKEVFGTKLCAMRDLAEITLQNLWDCEARVLVFYHNKLTSSYPEIWPGNKIPSPWGNTVDKSTLLRFLNKNFLQGRQCNKFYVTQGILTPDAKYVIEHLTGSLKSQLAIKMAPTFVDWVKEKNTGQSGINICILDFVEMRGYIDAIIHLNYKEAS